MDQRRDKIVNDTNIKTACGSEVVTEEISSNHNGKVIYFCETECLREFSENPDKFIKSDHYKLELSNSRGCVD